MRTLVQLAPDVIAANRRLFTAALRSGDYAQTTGNLRVNDDYCCLGVLETVRGCSWITVGPVGTEDVSTEGVNVNDLDDGDVVYVLADPRTTFVDPAGAPLLYDNDYDDAVPVTVGSDDGQVATVLTADGVHWLGVTTTDPYVVVHHDGRWQARSLTVLNDMLHLPFARIADVVDDQPPDWDGSERRAFAEAARRTAREGVISA